MAKDYFSEQSKIYATFRPSYPKELYDFIYTHLINRNTAWDCATGNGQVAQYLSNDFREVYATDISQQQIDHAFLADNIFYSVCPAERTTFAADTFDLITVAQALHWINTAQFYQEATRVAKPGALLAIWGYAVLSIEPSIDPIFLHFYHNVVGPYWDAARKLVEDQYKNIPFPFAEVQAPAFELKVDWSREQFSGYLSSWSSTRKFIQVNHADPVAPFIAQLDGLWKPGEIKRVNFPLFMRLGKIEK